MERKTVVFTVTTSIAYTDEALWRKSVRVLRKILKDEIGKVPEMKVLKIESKEG